MPHILNDASDNAPAVTRHYLLDRLLADVHARLGDRPLPKLTLFDAHVGSGYDGELMVVGRALNGGIEEFDLAEAGTSEGRSRIISDTWSTIDDSAPTTFWRVVQRAARGSGIDGPEWATKLLWSNLYKLSPYEAGNPSDPLCDAQLPTCIELLRHELETHRPKRVLFVTAWGWFQWFAAGLGFQPVEGSWGEVVEALGRIGGTLAVVTRRPEFKPEDEYVEHVLRHFAPAADVMSREQQREFEAVSGYSWDGVSVEGSFRTNCPGGERTWSLSPWDFTFKVIDGHLFMELDHRMTNNRTRGVDRSGTPLPANMVVSVFPSHF